MTNTQRLTISLPDYLYQQLQTYAPKRQTSRFVAEAIEAAVFEEKISAAEKILQLKKNLPKISYAQIKRAIARGRM